MAETPALIIALTQEQQLQVLAATGLRVTTLEVPLETLADGGEALARIPIADGLQQRTARADREEVNENG
jgi:hypothetical protein